MLKVIFRLFLLALLLCSTQGQAQLTSFQTGSQIDQAKKQDADPYVGKTFWLLPNLSGTSRISFSTTSKESGYRGSDAMYPSAPLHFKVVEHLKQSSATDYYEQYRVNLVDGSNLYLQGATLKERIFEPDTETIEENTAEKLRAYLFDNPKLWNGASYSRWEILFKEDPEALKNKLTIFDRDMAERQHQRQRQIASAPRKAEPRKVPRGGVTVGMSREEVLASSWGRPSGINSTITGNTRSEQWVYAGNNYLYFNDRILTTIQTSR